MAKIFNIAAQRVLNRFGFKQNSFNFHGSTVFYVEGGNPKGPTLLILPGFGDTVYSWTGIMLRYAKKCRILALDFPGYTGFSPKPKTRTLDFAHQDQVALHFLKEIVKHADFVVGNSMGGWIAFRLALAAPECVGHVVGINPAGIFTNEEELLRIRNLYEIGSYKDYVRLMSHLWHKIPLYFYPFSLLGFYQFTKTPDFSKLLHSIELSHFLNDDLKHLKVPASVVWGLNDRLFGEHMVKVLLNKAPHVHYYPIAQAGHMPQVERPKEFFKIFDSILS